ncbi:murein L,D-transpeptidase catalytic domain-containing protein [Dysgonomonas sp. 25]|uniref:murein L,D-transpeptidase catalytic domain-containing protein n=1 Tax=Dysgonomonas sp. 25 TaxID=2302933 RepID=UPI0013D4CFAC|nr:murein L,D-transpeptidase catalytic domain family protein [Dysgonomonas sp. 25]NDV67623.1 peptidase [Dysgonomonas sp. 25]
MKKIILIGGGIIVALLGIFFYIQHINDEKMARLAEEIRLEEEAIKEKEDREWQITFDRAKAKADSAKLFCEKNNLRTDYCILVDFKVHSGKNRLFVWNFEQDTIVDANPCCHGYGNQQNRSTAKKIVFSNVPGSLCSSLGKFKTAYRDKCNYGTLFQYRIHGLDKTNDNAFSRFVTLHSYSAVPDKEIYPEHIPLGYSQGCFIVSDYMLYRLDNLMKMSDIKMLIWSYY